MYGLDNKAKGKKGVTGMARPDAKDLEGLGITAFSKERLDKLATPVNKDMHRVLHEIQTKTDKELGKEDPHDKQM